MPALLKGNQLRLIFMLVLSIATLAACLLFWRLDQERQRRALPQLFPSPAFELTRHSGENFSSSRLSGEVWILDFIFTRCSVTCPMMIGKMSALQKKLKNVQFVSMTVDPKNDTPEALQSYIQKHSIPTSNWHFLTGPWDTINQIAHDLKVAGAEEPMFHSSSFILIDRQGYVRGYYHAEDKESMDKLARDARLLRGL